MFFKQIRRNASKNRNSNGLFFSSLIIAIVAFYTLLSLGKQDVIVFLRTLESDAVNRLMSMLPIIYMVSLFFVFFLVYFACYYQLDNRKKEFGLYLMLGMKRSKLFIMLLLETIWNSIRTILIGLPAALLLTECISLATSKVIGLGIVGHKISFSMTAAIGTAIGFIAVQMLAMLLLSIKISIKEPIHLLQMDLSDKQSSPSSPKRFIYFIIGLLLLILAYIMGVIKNDTFDYRLLGIIFLFGITGTFFLYHGMGAFIGSVIQRKSAAKSGLFTFTGRQIQEHVLHQYKLLAVSSLLLFMALACISFGIGIVLARGTLEERSVDFSIDGNRQEISKVLETKENKAYISACYPMFINNIEKDASSYSLNGIYKAIKSQPQSDVRDNIMASINFDYVIDVESYNAMLTSIGQKPIKLKKNQVALYTSHMKDSRNFTDLIDHVLKSDAYIEVDSQRYELLPKLYMDNIVADRKITLYTAFIVSEENYQKWAVSSREPICYNVLLNQKMVKDMGLMQAIKKMDSQLAGTGLEYESYLGGVGRSLFYTVAASYLTIYLGFLFLIIANTVIGLKFLMQQRSNIHRYFTLQMLGTSTKEICTSAKHQIYLFFILAFSVALCNSVFAVWSMFTNIMKLPAGISIGKLILFTALAFILFVVIELIYIYIITKISNREIRTLKINDRR